MGKNVNLTVPPERREEEHALLQALAQGQEMAPYRATRVRKSGERFQATVAASPIKDSAGTTNGIVCFIREVKVVPRPQDTLRLVLEACPNGMLLVDSNGAIAHANGHAERLLGHSEADLIGRPFEILISERFREGHLAYCQNFETAPPARWGQELYCLNKDGHEVPVEMGLNPLQTEDGQYLLASVVDITERKRAEQRITDSEAQFRALAETVPHLVWTCGADGRCEYLSPQWVEYTGMPEKEHLNFGWLQQVHPEDRERTKRAWNEACASDQSFDVEYRLLGHDGAHQWFKVRAVAQKNEQGEVLKWYGSNTNIQDLRDAEQSLQTLNRELEKRIQSAVGDLREANLELESLAHELQDAQRLARLGSWELELGSGKVSWSNELFKVFGLDREEQAPTYDQQEKLFGQESWAVLQAAVDRALQSGQGYSLELEVLRPGGANRWIQAKGEAKRNSTYQIVGLLGTAQDVTELKSAQLELAATSERVLLATEAARIGVWDFDFQRDELVWDGLMHELYGTEPTAFGGRFQDWRSSLHPEDLEATESDFLRAVEEKRPFDSDFRIVTPGGRIKYLKGRAHIHYHRDGTVARAVGVNYDITQQREAELSLQSSEQLLRDFVRYAPAAIAMLDRDLCYLQASERWLSDYNLVGETLEGRCHYDVFPDVPERWKAIHQRVLAGSVERCEEEAFPRADGRCDWLQWEVRPWKDAHGHIGGLLFFTQVITARKEMQLKLQRQKDDLERSNHDLEQFAYVASHDLQEPLRAVSGCSQILARRYQEQLDGRADELIKHIVEGVERMQRLINDLLSYSRVDRKGSAFAVVDSRKALDDALLLLSAAIEESGAVVTAESTFPMLHADAGQLKHLFANLIGNSIKYRGHQPPAIRVSVQPEGEKWQFRVQDNGIGIAPEHISRIFLLFQRLHTRDEYPGTGIGLALCQKIVARHGGRIWVESTVGKGSTFCFTVPGKEG